MKRNIKCSVSGCDSRRTPKTVAGKAMNEVQWREFNRNVERLICEVLCVDEATLADAMTDYLAPNYRRAA